MTTPHPAPFSRELIPHLVEACSAGSRHGEMLDPFAGIGRGAEVAQALGMPWVGIELEPEWAEQDERIICGDSRNLLELLEGRTISIVCTSPTYGNRMADRYGGSPSDLALVRDGKRIPRRTYRISLGRPLSEGNTGAHQFGQVYRDLHEQIWQQCFWVLEPGGLFVLNVSDHFRNHMLVPVTEWHIETLRNAGFELEGKKIVPTPRFRRGQNHEMRTDGEWVLSFRKPW